MSKVKNFARFYACLNSVQTDDKVHLKESLVSQFTDGRTSSLREMSQAEYNAMCNSIDPKSDKEGYVRLKSKRSVVLRRLQKLGVDTTDWNAVDKFCLNNRIAGKVFHKLSIEELNAIIPKLIAISKRVKPTPVQVSNDEIIGCKCANNMVFDNKIKGVQFLN